MTSLHTLGPVKPPVHVDPALGVNWFALTSNLGSDPTLNGTSFASLFQGATNAAPSSPSSTTNADPLAQLNALLQSGVPMPTIVDRLAQQIAGAVQQQLSAQTSANAGARLKSTLVQSIANALAPPGNAPPGNATDQVAALAQRLRELIARIAGDAKNTAGQQNDIAGQILDAKSAKEIPAQRKSETASTQVDSDTLARALLNSVAASFTNTAAANASPATTVASQSVPQAPATPVQNALVSQMQAASAPSQITVANAPDVLARMLVRAAGVDARINGVAAQGAQVPTNSGTDSTPSALAARFQNLLANLGAQSDGSGTQTNSNGSNFMRDFTPQSDSKAPADASQLGISVAANAPVSNASFTAQTQALTHASVDANAVVEQVVKSMVMRTNQSGSSEIRLRLNPDNLGEVTMKLTVNGSSISANLVAQNGDVRNALLSNHQQLARSLSEAGLTLTGFSVDVSGGDAGRDQNRDRTGGFGRRYIVHEFGGSGDATETAQTTSLGPPLLANSSLELFNYLA